MDALFENRMNANHNYRNFGNRTFSIQVLSMDIMIICYYDSANSDDAQINVCRPLPLGAFWPAPDAIDNIM